MSIAERLRKVGEAQGELRGRSATLVRQLQRRFGELPESTVRRVEAATLAELELWTDRVLDRRTLRAVFAAPRPATRMKARVRAATPADDQSMSVAERLQQEGRAQGRPEGRVDGLIHGRHTEASWTVLAFLNKRFPRRLPDGILLRVSATPLAELNLWIVRIFDGATLEGVFEAAPTLATEPRGFWLVQRLHREVQARGMPADLANVWAKAFAGGFSAGYDEGWREGQVLQAIETILLLLGKRFGALPENIVNRVKAAPLGQLQLWRDRVLDARTLDEVFTAQRDRSDWDAYARYSPPAPE